MLIAASSLCACLKRKAYASACPWHNLQGPPHENPPSPYDACPVWQNPMHCSPAMPDVIAHCEPIAPSCFTMAFGHHFIMVNSTMICSRHQCCLVQCITRHSRTISDMPFSSKNKVLRKVFERFLPQQMLRRCWHAAIAVWHPLIFDAGVETLLFNVVSMLCKKSAAVLISAVQLTAKEAIGRSSPFHQSSCI